MFRGSNEINMDAKGRMAMPGKHKDALLAGCEGQLMVTIDISDRCLLIYPLPEWRELEGKVNALPTLNAATRRMQRLLIGHAKDVDMDANGRILIPPELRNFAELKKKVTVVGQGHRLELWSSDNWNTQRDIWIGQQADESDVPADIQSISL